jgi:hypothetical protein
VLHVSVQKVHLSPRRRRTKRLEGDRSRHRRNAISRSPLFRVPSTASGRSPAVRKLPPQRRIEDIYVEARRLRYQSLAPQRRVRSNPTRPYRAVTANPPSGSYELHDPCCRLAGLLLPNRRARQNIGRLQFAENESQSTLRKSESELLASNGFRTIRPTALRQKCADCDGQRTERSVRA